MCCGLVHLGLWVGGLFVCLGFGSVTSCYLVLSLVYVCYGGVWAGCLFDCVCISGSWCCFVGLLLVVCDGCDFVVAFCCFLSWRSWCFDLCFDLVFGVGV